jgi:phosphoribosylanthranilate isomerase
MDNPPDSNKNTPHHLIKICGLSTVATLHAAQDAGAHWLGMVFYPGSPRHLEPPAAAALLRQTGRTLPVVAVTVAPDEATLDSILTVVRPDLLQVHGAWTPARMATVRNRHGIPTIRALGVATAHDLAEAEAWMGAADWLLLDAKAPAGGLPGGNRLSFDWNILRGWHAPLPWLLAGGLDAENVTAALRLARPTGVDVSSGVESAPGIKDTALIHTFVAAAQLGSVEI